MKTAGNYYQPIWNKLNRQLETLHAQLANVPEDKYSIQPDPTSWSLEQVFNHLYLSEKNSFAYIRKKLQYPDTLEKYSPKSLLSLWSLLIVMRTPYKAKAPQAINMWQNQETLSPAELIETWKKQRNEMRSFIEANDDYRNHLVFRHPKAGRLTMHQMLRFINGHIQHHQKQIDRLILHLG